MINRERNEGTLSKLLSQPIYRDTVVNAKFLAGMAVIAIMLVSIVLVITGLGLFMLGIVPGLEEIWRIAIYLLISIIYIAFWLGVSILFSILSRSVATSALAALAVWIFFSFFMSLGANAIAGVLTPDAGPSHPEALVQVGMMEKISMSRFSGPLPLSQSFLVVLPYIITLIAITMVCFAISYTVFIRQEIRSI